MNIDNENREHLSCKAWILPFANRIYTAISEFEIVHILAGRQKYTHVPRTPLWCQFVFTWCDQLIPLFDLNIYMNLQDSRESTPVFSSNDIICIVSYKDQGGILRYGGLLLSSLPFARTVSDDQICNYPPSPAIDWSKLAISCFNDNEIGAIPILDIPQIFCNPIAQPV